MQIDGYSLDAQRDKLRKYVEDGIDSSKDSGKRMISVLSTVAEIERENIRTQTMEGWGQNLQVKKLLFISNLKSGKNQIKPHFSTIIDMFVAAGYEVTVHTTQAVKDAYQVAAARGSDYDLVVCSGGDGTLDEVVSGLIGLKRQPVLGYIPAGTTNDFAKSLGISSNMTAAAANVLNGAPFAIDVGVFNDRYFAYVAAFGAFTDVSWQTPQELKNTFGHLAYLMEGLKSLPSITPHRMTVEFDDEVITDSFAYGMVTNSVSVGGFKSIGGKGMELNDGLFEMLLVRMPKTLFELQAIMSAFLLQKVDERYMFFAKVDHVHFSSEKEISWTLDGEEGGCWKEVELSNIKQAIRIIRPVDKAEIQKVKEEYEALDIKEQGRNTL